MTTQESEATAVATRPATPGNAVVPAELNDLFAAQAGVGLEDMTQADRVTPFLGLIQGLSPQVDRTKPQYIAEARTGDLFNTVTREVYTNETGGLRVIPVLFQKVWNQWIPRKEGGGFLGSYSDKDLKNPIFVPPSSADYDGPADTIETANHFVLAQSKDGSWQPAVISMKVTQLKASRNWNTQTTIAASKYKAPIWARIYRITSVSQQNDQGTFFNYKIDDIEFVTKELFLLADSFRKDVQAGIARADMTKAEDAGVETAPATDEKRF